MQLTATIMLVYDGSDLRNFGYSLTLGHGCESTNPNYCFGYLTGYDKTFPHHTNSSEIWLQANSSGAMNGSGQSTAAPSKIVCTVSPYFCKAFMHGYILAYTRELPYNQGRDAGQKYVDMLISRCYVFNNPHIPSHQPLGEEGGLTLF